ncbi:MAG: hypothetical protein JJU00_18335, partial [Opitutales bacterium]|nr:hypothetical protein [Opitutales bacterium]
MLKNPRLVPNTRSWKEVFLIAFVLIVLCAPERASAFAIMEIERVEAPAGWRISWESEPGVLYRVEAGSDLSPENWQEVALIEATAHITAVTDTTLPPPPGRRFWRVARLTSEGGVYISAVAAYADETEPLPQTVFAVTAASDATVTEVRFFSGGQLRGVAEQTDLFLWELRESYNPAHPQAVELFAEARDSLNRTAQSPVARFLLADPERFVPLAANGDALPGSFVRLNADGTLGPFEFRPDGGAPVNARTGLVIAFPSGAALIFSEGRYLIEFNTGATLRRGAFDPQPQTGGAGTLLRLPTDDLRVADLAPITGAAPGTPLPLHLLSGVPVLWEEGALGAQGLAAATPTPDWSGIGTPPLPGAPRRAEMVTDPRTGEPVYQVSYDGTFLLPGGVVLQIPRQAPWVFRIQNDWRIDLSGETELFLPNGARLSGSVRWRNGTVGLSLSAHNLTLEALGSLLEFLPPDPAAQVPGAPDDTAMNLAATAMEAYRKAYRNFASGAVRIDSIDRERDLIPLLDPVETATASLEAWSWRLVSRAAESPGPTGILGNAAREAVARLTDNAAKSARAAYDLPETLAWKAGLLRLAAALEDEDDPDLTAALADAGEVFSAVLDDRLRTADRTELVGLVAETTRAWLDLIAEIERSGIETEPSLAAFLEKWLRTTGGLYFERLGIEAGEFDPVLNDTVLGLDRFSAAAALKAVLDLVALAQWLGLEAAAEEWPADEALQQLLTRWLDLHNADMRDFLRRGSFEAVMLIVRQRLEIMAEMQLLGLDEAFPEVFQDPVLTARMDEIATRWLNNPARPARRDSLLEALRYVSRILAYVPDNAATFAASVHGDLLHVLGEFMQTGRFNEALRPRDWMEWLEGALLAEGLGRRHLATTSLTEPGTGEETRSPLQILVDGLIEASGGAAGSTVEPQYAFLDQAAGRLLTEIQSLRVEIADPALGTAAREERRAMRLAYIEALGRILTAYQRVATRLYTEAAATPGTLAYAADLLLPGTIRIHELAGAARYTPATGFLAGRFSGSVALPKFDARLTVPNASFDTRGNFRLAAYGQAGFPGGLQAAPGRVLLRVPARRPLSLSLSDTGAFALSGGAELTLPGGHRISGYLAIDDPSYVFELAYGGAARFELMKEVTLFRPVFAPGTLDGLDTLGAFGRLYGSIGTGFEAFLEGMDESQLPAVGMIERGTPPDFSTPVTTVPLDAWDAWLTPLVNTQLIDRLNGGIDGSVAKARALLQSARDDARSAQQELAPTLNRIQTLRERLERARRMRELLPELEEAQLLGNEETAEILAELEAHAVESAEAARRYLAALPAGASLPLRFAAQSHAFAADAEAAALGVATFPDLNTAAANLNSGALALLAEAGLDANGNITDPAAFAALDNRRLRVLAGVFLELQVMEQFGGTETFRPPGGVDFEAMHAFFIEAGRARAEADWEAARDRGDAVALALAARWLLDYNEAGEDVEAIIEDPDRPAQLSATDVILAETLALIRTVPDFEKRPDDIAWNIIETVNRNFESEQRTIPREIAEILGLTEETRISLRDANAIEREPGSFFTQIVRHWELLGAAGVLDPVRLAENRASLGGLLTGALNRVAEGIKPSAPTPPDVR